MVLPFVAQAIEEGFDSIPYAGPVVWQILKLLPWVLGAYAIKAYCSGKSNPSERNMHGKVILVTVSGQAAQSKERG